MAQALAFFFDGDADAAVRARWRQLDRAGVPSMAGHSHGRHRPQVTFAVAGAIPAKARAALRAELDMLSVPALWLYTLGTFLAKEHTLFLGAVADPELLAVHSAVHDVLAGRARDPWAYYLPSAWVPHCALAVDVDAGQLAAGFAALQGIEPIRASIAEIGILDTRTGEVEPLDQDG